MNIDVDFSDPLHPDVDFSDPSLEFSEEESYANSEIQDGISTSYCRNSTAIIPKCDRKFRQRI